MSQDSNTKNDTSSKPRLTIARGPNDPASGSAAAGPGSPTTPPPEPVPAAGPRLAFTPKKKAEETPAAPAEEAPALKRPPPGTPLTASTPVAPEAAAKAPPTVPFHQAAPVPQPRKRNIRTLVLFGVMVLIIGAQSAYILWHDDEVVEANQQMPPIVVPNQAAQSAPITISATPGSAPTPAAAFLQTFSPGIAAGDTPRLILNGRTFYLNDVVAPEFGLKWTRINDQARELEFTDKQGRRYVKKF